MVLFFLYIFALSTYRYRPVLKIKNMTPTSFILTAAFVFFLFPFEKSSDFQIKKEKEVENNTSMSVNLHLRSNNNNPTGNSDEIKKGQMKTKKINLVLPSETFNEPTLEVEDWMKSPKTWNNSNEL
jgi:hypothetical protein